MSDLPIVDGHLDLAENVTIFGRDLTRTAGFLASDVAGVGDDFVPRSAIYRTQEEAEAQALGQIRLYESWQAQGRVRLLKSATDLDDHLQLWQADRKPGLVLLMEGADPIVRVADLPKWWQLGLRMIGVTFGDTVYGRGVAGGRAEHKRGGFTPEGFALLDAMAERGFVWDISHLTEDGVRQGLDRGIPHVCASHANARALAPTDRHLSDDVIRAIGERGGVIGLVLYNGFIEPLWRQERSIVVTLSEHLRRHAEHIARIAGWEHVGIGSDLDGGLGLEESPVEIDTIADLHRVEGAVPIEARDAV